MAPRPRDGIESLAEVLLDNGYPSGTKLTLTLQASHEHPYQILVPEEEFPLVGVVQAESQSGE